MKQLKIILMAALFMTGGIIFAQDIPQKKVPSVIVNNFQQSFPKANDVEWELKGDQYKVEFEVGILGQDHDVWYDKSGHIIRHKEEISKTDLPEKVQATLETQYPGYRIKDVEKITQDSEVVYKLEAKNKSQHEEWELALTPDGKIVSKKAD